jgi:hypothetical protein
MQAIRVLGHAHPKCAVMLAFKIETVESLVAFKGPDLLPGFSIGADLNSAVCCAPTLTTLEVLNHDPGDFRVMLKADGNK